MTMRSDVERGELSQPRVLFRSNNEDTVNKTVDLITSPASCFKWEAFLVRTPLMCYSVESKMTVVFREGFEDKMSVPLCFARYY